MREWGLGPLECDSELAKGLARFDPTPGAGTSLREFDLYALNTCILDQAASNGFRDTHPGRIESLVAALNGRGPYTPGSNLSSLRLAS